MSYKVSRESFSSLASYWNSPTNRLKWDVVFMLPAWMEVWWREFQPESELYLSAVKDGADIIGIAPLQISGKTASFIGSPDVCDYLDFIVAAGRENDFFTVLLDDLRQKGVNLLELGHVRPDSTVFTRLLETVRSRGYEVSTRGDEVSLELDLPPDWDEYLGMLTGKQRHELKRKMRRLEEWGGINFRTVTEKRAVAGLIDTFLKLFSESRDDKAAFMTEKMQAFFRSATVAMADTGLLRLGILELGAAPVAMAMSFDYNNVMYLYNSGYDPEYRSLSVGLVSKALFIQDSIQQGRKKFDFLKGSEAYKYHLGGKEIPLYSFQIAVR